MQSVVLQADTTRARTQRCPIDKCPNEILLMIFEEVTQIDEDDRFKEATSLSHVCKRWRILALQTSSLWSQIHIFMTEDDIEDVQEFLDRTRLRLGSTPAAITIQDVDKDDELWEPFMERLNLNRFPHIAELNLHLEAYADFWEPFHDSLRYSNGPLDSMIIAGDSSSQQLRFEWRDCTIIFQNFPTARRVMFLELHNLSICCEDSFPHVTGLSFQDIHGSPNIIFRLNQFPNLTALSLKNIETIYEHWDAQEIILPSLQELEVDDVDFPWDKIHAPHLQSLKFHGPLSYLQPHRYPLLKHLDCQKWWLEDCDIWTLSNTVGEVEKLGIYAGAFGALFSPRDHLLPFPNVTYLKLYIGGHAHLSLQEFEDLVRCRCLQQHGRLGCKQIEILEFEGLVEDLDEQSWHKSSLLSHFESFIRVRNSDIDGTILLKLKPCSSN